MKARLDFETLYGWLQDRDASILKADRKAPLVVLALEDVLGILSADPKPKHETISYNGGMK